MQGIRVFLAHIAKRYRVCEDLQRYIFQLTQTSCCHRCGVVTETNRRVATCFVGRERLCFACYHRARWPSWRTYFPMDSGNAAPHPS